MHTVTSPKGSSRPDERRRHLRHKVPSIMYVELGSGNGGIVVNLGTDGVACQAANRVTTPPNTNLRIRLRGSGLNTEVDGKLVWLGSTQKEVGISFKEVSGDARQSIEEWIAREFQTGDSASTDARTQAKMSPVLPAMPRAERKSAHPLSAALSASREAIAALPSPADAVVKEALSGSNLPSTLSSLPSTESSTAGIPPKIDTAVASARVLPTAHSPEDSKAEIAVSTTPAPQSAVELSAPIQTASEVSSMVEGAETATRIASSAAVIESSIPVQSKEANLARATDRATGELSMKAEPAPAPNTRYSGAWKRFSKSAEWEKWIPPAILDTWHKANRRHRIALAATAGVCALSFFLVLIFAASSFVGHSTVNGSTPQSMAPSATTSIGPGDVRDASAQPRPRVVLAPPSDASDDSPFTNFIQGLFAGSDKAGVRTAVALDESRVGVQVWTSKTSGYYYCIDQPFYKNVRPGAYMTQRDALQSGYQPKLGQFCD